ncbi:hypothetical protein GV64_22180 [Endozoicomonas elysicola]|uniref:LysR substrate-binding domain-containing protein n=2 Tax=Endozoicomonas elysicola TaxID=305900 RepID=A0A081KFY7_9GAMM|nr:hypothetical protein GV64_22180 [Endozoicomonas elysicola]
MAPTEQAKLISPSVRQAMLLLEQSINNTPVFEPAHSKAKFRLAGGDYVELVLLPVLMERIALLAPDIKIEIEGLKATDYSRELESGAIDLVIGFETLGRLAKSLRTTSIITEQLVVIAPKPIDNVQEMITADNMKLLKFIYPSTWGHSQALMDEWCQQQGIERNIAIKTSGFVAVPVLMEKLGLVTALPSAIARYYEQQFGFIYYPIASSELTYRHLLAWHPLRDKDPSLVWLKQQIIKAAETIESYDAAVSGRS